MNLIAFIIPLASLHFPHTGQNQINPGLAAEFGGAGPVTYAVGAYENSYHRTTAFGQVVWTPLRRATALGELGAGASVGLGTGYRSPVIGGAFLRLGMAHLTIIPPTGGDRSGVIGFALRIPVAK
jgi:hypothetical protein